MVQSNLEERRLLLTINWEKRELSYNFRKGTYQSLHYVPSIDFFGLIIKLYFNIFGLRSFIDIQYIIFKIKKNNKIST